MTTVEEHFDWLMRSNQINLAELDRERLEQLALALLHGQLTVFQTLAQETRQSALIASQKEMISSLTHATDTANAALMALEEPSEGYYKEMVFAMIDLVARTWGQDTVFPDLMTALWRSVEEGIKNGDIQQDSPTARWWQSAVQENFGFVKKESPNDNDEKEEQAPEEEDV